MFPHKSSQWDWSKYHQFLSSSDPKGDMCVILHDLCVIDVDTSEDASAPHTVPCESTKRGRHYWFIRSTEADKDGYYDGAAQRISHVDFKTICQTGTGGIIVVAPSKDKKWIRPMWKRELVPIPFDLLDAVAVPRHKFVDVSLHFNDGFVGSFSNWLHVMSYFEPMFEEDVSDFPVPCSQQEFLDLVGTLEMNEIIFEDPTPERMDALIATADILGLGHRYTNRIVSTGTPRLQLEVYRFCPEWWHAHVIERDSDDFLKDVPQCIQYESLDWSESFMFHRMVPSGRNKSGENLIFEGWSVSHVVSNIARDCGGFAVDFGG